VNLSFLLQSLQHRTPLQLAAHYGYRGAHRALGAELYQVLALTPSSARDVSAPQGVECRFGQPDELRAAARDEAFGMSPAQVDEALARGERCYVATVQGTIACHLWLTERRAHLAGPLSLEFDPSWGYVRWATTLRGYRGLHLHAIAKRKALDLWVEGGKRGLLSAVSIVNFASLESAAHVGSARSGFVGWVRVRGTLHHAVSPEAARFGLRLVEAAPDAS